MSQTGLAAYNYLRDNDVLSRLRWVVYDCLFHHGPMTRNELDAHLRGSSAINPSYSRRLVELERMGMAKRTHVRACGYTGHLCDAWEVTNRIEPLVPKKSTTKGEKIAACYALFEEMEEQLHRIEQGDRLACWMRRRLERIKEA